MEQIIMEIMEKEAKDMAQEMIKNNEKNQKKLEENELEMEENILINSDKTPLVYIGIVEDNLAKFGYSKGIQKRVLLQHKKDFNKFILKYTIHSENYIELEDAIKQACREPGLLNERRVSKVINDRNQTELIRLDDSFTAKDFYKEVLNLKNILEKKKKLGKSKTIAELRVKIRKQEEEINKLRSLCQENGIEIDFNVTKISQLDLLVRKYFYKFLEHFTQDKDEGIHFISNKDFYNQYFSFIQKSYDLMYVYTKEHFNTHSSRLPFAKYARRNMKKEDPNYIKGKDNRIRGKNIIVSANTRKWIVDQY